MNQNMNTKIIDTDFGTFEVELYTDDYEKVRIDQCLHFKPNTEMLLGYADYSDGLYRIEQRLDEVKFLVTGTLKEMDYRTEIIWCVRYIEFD